MVKIWSTMLRVRTALAVFLVMRGCAGARLLFGLPVTSVDCRTDTGVGFLEPLHLPLQLRGGARQGGGNAKGERARANATLTPKLPPKTAAQTGGQNATHEHTDASGELNWEDELPDALRGVPQDEWLQKVDELRAAKEVACLSLSARLLWCRVCMHSGCGEAQLGGVANRRESARGGGPHILLTSGQQELKEAFRRTRSKPDAKKLLVAQDAYARAKRYLMRAAGATLRAAQVFYPPLHVARTRPASVCVWPSLTITSLHFMCISSFPSSMVAAAVRRMHAISHASHSAACIASLTPHKRLTASHTAHMPMLHSQCCVHACSSLAHIQAPERMCVFEGGRVEGGKHGTGSLCGRGRFQPTTPPGDPRLPQRVWGATQRMLARRERRRQTEGRCK